MIQEFSFTFEDLKIKVSDLAELLGYQDTPVPEPFRGYIQDALKNAGDICNIRAGYRIFDDVYVDKIKQSIQIKNQIFHPGKIVTTQLNNSKKIAIFLCTAGNEIIEYSRKLSNDSDPMLGYIYDVLGSVVVEKATDNMEIYLQEKLLNENLNLSERFSPGYCDWSVSEQERLFALLPQNFCGISLSATSLMQPIKSVSGFTGIGANLKKTGYQCNWCNDTNCIYGKLKRKKMEKN